MTTLPPSDDALDQATAQMLAAAAVVAKALMQTDPANELTDELWEACQLLETSVGRVRELRGVDDRVQSVGGEVATQDRQS